MGRNGGLLSVALSRESPQTDVIRHPVLLEPGLSSGGHCDMTASDPLSLWQLHPISLILPRQGLLRVCIDSNEMRLIRASFLREGLNKSI